MCVSCMHQGLGSVCSWSGTRRALTKHAILASTHLHEAELWLSSSLAAQIWVKEQETDKEQEVSPN